MANSASFANSFPALLNEIPSDLTLPQWQYLYRQMIVSMGLKILDLFQQDAMGPNPFDPTGRGGSSGGPAAGPIKPPPPPPPGKGEPGSLEFTGRGGSTGGPQPALSIAEAALGLRVIPGTKS